MLPHRTGAPQTLPLGESKDFVVLSQGLVVKLGAFVQGFFGDHVSFLLGEDLDQVQDVRWKSQIGVHGYAEAACVAVPCLGMQVSPSGP